MKMELFLGKTALDILTKAANLLAVSHGKYLVFEHFYFGIFAASRVEFGTLVVINNTGNHKKYSQSIRTLL